MQCLNTFNIEFIYLCKKYAIQTSPVGGQKGISKQKFFTRFASKRYINNYQIYFGAINAVLIRFEEKKSINLISKWGSLIYMLYKSISSILR